MENEKANATRVTAAAIQMNLSQLWYKISTLANSPRGCAASPRVHEGAMLAVFVLAALVISRS